MMSKRLLVFYFLFLWFFVGSSVTAEDNPSDILLIVNSQANIQSTNLEEVKNLFLRKKQAWRSGESAVPVHPKDATLRAAFAQRVLGMSRAEESIYWQDMKIKKGLAPPTELPNPLKAIFKLRNGVSYILRKDYKEGVAKILLVIPAP